MSIRQALLLGLTAAVILASAAGAGHDAARQRLAITFQLFASASPASAKFRLVPLTTGALRGDSGTSSVVFSWKPDVMRDGQTVAIETAVATGKGKRGSFEIRIRNEWVAAGSISSGYLSGMGTWTFLRGTGQYAGVTGGGRSGLVWLQSGRQPIWGRYEGFLAAP